MEIKAVDYSPKKGLYWVQLSFDAMNKRTVKPFAIPDLVLDILSTEETRPRILAYGDSLIANFRGVNVNQGSDPEDMISLRMWVQKNLIVTVRRRALPSVDDIERSLLEGTGPMSSGDFLETLLTFMTDNSSDVVSVLGDELDQLEDQLCCGPGQRFRKNLSDLRRRIIMLRRYLVPQREAISRIPIDKISWLNESNGMHFREIADASTRVLEDLDSEREQATVIQEELFALSQEAMNQKMYLLSLVAIIFMPLSFVTGLLGINVGGIPGTSFRYAFLIVCLVLFVVFLIQLYYLKRKQWI